MQAVGHALPALSVIYDQHLACTCRDKILMTHDVGHVSVTAEHFHGLSSVQTEHETLCIKQQSTIYAYFRCIFACSFFLSFFLSFFVSVFLSFFLPFSPYSLCSACLFASPCLSFLLSFVLLAYLCDSSGYIPPQFHFFL